MLTGIDRDLWIADGPSVTFLSVLHGSFAMEEVVFFHRASRTAVVADLVQRFAPPRCMAGATSS